MLWFGHGRPVYHLPLGGEDGTICLPTGEIVPAPGLFGHNSWRVASENLRTAALSEIQAWPRWPSDNLQRPYAFKMHVHHYHSWRPRQDADK